MWWAHAVSRAAPVWLLRALPYAGELRQSKAQPLAARGSRGGNVVTLVWLALLHMVLVWTLGAFLAIHLAVSDVTASVLTACMAS